MIRRAAIAAGWAVGLSVALALVAVAAAGFWLLQTASGSRWLWDRAVAAIPGELDAAAVDGSLADGFRLSGVVYKSPSLTVNGGNVTLALDLDLVTPAVNIVDLHIEDAVVQVLPAPPSGEERAGFALENLALPVPLNIESVSIRNVRVLNANGDPLVTVGSAELAGNWSDRIALSRLRVESSRGNVSGTVALGLRAPYAANAEIAASYPLRSGTSAAVPLRVAANAHGTLENLQIDVSGEQPSLSLTGTLSGLTEKPGWDLQLQSPFLRWPLDGPSPPVSVHEFELHSSGNLAAWSLAGDGTVSLVALRDDVLFSLKADGDGERLKIDELALHGRTIDARSGGEVRWKGGLSIAANADLERYDPSRLTDAWPAGKPVTGTVRVAWSGDKVELTDARLGIRGTDQTIAAKGRVDLSRGEVDLDLDWQDLQWPIETTSAATAPGYRSAFGKIEVSGKPESWALDGRIAFQAAALPQGTFVLSGTGNRKRAALTLDESQVLGGTVAGLLTWNWQDAKWSGRLTVADVATAPLASGWPGHLSGDFAASGQLHPLRIGIDIGRLDGVLRERKVEGKGGILYTRENLDADRFQVSFGDASLQANGSLQSTAGLDFALTAGSLADFNGQASGSLEAHGNLSLAAGFPALKLDLQGEHLAWRDQTIEELSVSSKEGGADTPIELTADGKMLSLGPRGVDEFSVTVAAGESRQRLDVKASADDKQLEIAVDGRFDDWRRPFESPWKGRLTALNFEAPEDATFTLARPAALVWQDNAVSLGRTCIAGMKESRICAVSRWAGSKDFDLTAELAAVPVNLLRLAVDTDLRFTQTLDGSVSVASAPTRALAAEAQVDISPGQIQSQGDSRLVARTGAGHFGLKLDNGRLLSGRFVLPFSDQAEINANFNLVDVAAGTKSGVNGALKVNLRDIGVLSNIYPAIDAASGGLDVDMTLAGTLANPVFSGKASLTNGALSYAPLGLKLTEVELEGEVHENRNVVLKSMFTAGKGSGKLYSRAGSLAEIRDGLELSLSGDNLTLIDLPQINVVADTDLDLAILKQKLEIDGRILIPRARLSPVNLAAARVSESDDVAIVAGDTPGNVDKKAESPHFAISGQLDLELGKDVQVDLDVAKTKLSGSTRFAWNGPVMPTGNGEYKMTGKVEAYGQMLEITEGTIAYPGVPANNPVLRIRAERKIFGNPRVRSAGVLISGTAEDPELEVYTNPATDADTALALLVTGSDFNYEQGVGAVDVGTYIAPDLYLSYGIGLFERENVISVRYDLARGFGIKISSGQRADGVDLSYTIDK